MFNKAEEGINDALGIELLSSITVLIFGFHADAGAALGFFYCGRRHSFCDDVSVFRSVFIAIRPTDVEPHMRRHVVLNDAMAASLAHADNLNQNTGLRRNVVRAATEALSTTKNSDPKASAWSIQVGGLAPLCADALTQCLGIPLPNFIITLRPFSDGAANI
jgi:hypothetical protein